MSFYHPYFTENGWKESSFPYFEATLVFYTIMYIVETYLDYRQHKMLKVDQFPIRLEKVVRELDQRTKKTNSLVPESTQKDEEIKKSDGKDEKCLEEALKEKFHKSRAYGLEKSSFGFITSAYGHFEGMAFLLLGYAPWVWSISGHILSYYNYDSTNEITRALIFLSIMTLRDTIISIPFSLYSTFVIEERHGFNKQTMSLYFTDKIKSLLLSAVIGYPVIALIIYIIRWGGENFYIYVWAFLLFFSVIMLTIYPVLIMPLFNKFTPLEEGELRTKIEELAASLKFPLKKLFICDGSKRSSHSNAYFYGFFNSKRIVIFDTLLSQATNEEIVGILGHELGHWKLWHTMQGFIISQFYTLVAFYVFGRCMNDNELFASFGFSAESRPVIIGLILFFQTIWAPVDKVLNFILTLNSRRNEFQADAFAVELGYPVPLQTGLTKLHIENLGNLNPDPLYSAYHYSHPPLVERLSAINALTKKLD